MDQKELINLGVWIVVTLLAMLQGTIIYIWNQNKKQVEKKFDELKQEIHDRFSDLKSDMNNVIRENKENSNYFYKVINNHEKRISIIEHSKD